MIAVVGGGITGLAAAWELTGGATGPAAEGPSVVLLESSTRLGGKLASVQLCGRAVDVGPDSFLGRRPEATQLCREVGLGDELVPVATSGASIWARGRRRPIPEGLYLGVPTKLLPVARSGILSVGGTLRLAADILVPRPDTRGPLGDRAIGPLVSRKLGRQAVDRLVDPLVGGIHAGGVADASAAALFPALLTAAQRRSSLMRSLRQLRARGAHLDDQPLFWALRGGFASLVERLAERLGERGADVRLAQPVDRMGRAGARWVLEAGGRQVTVDGVVIATGTDPAAALLASHDPEAAAILRTIDYASVAVVTFAFPADALPDDLFGTGLLVPHGTPVPRKAARQLGLAAGEPFMVTACTYLWAKWPHLDLPGIRLLRASVGRAGDSRHETMTDDDLVHRVVQELTVLLDAAGEPDDVIVSRATRALPQYRVHHLLRVASVEAAVRRLGGVAIAGAAYHGVGIPACVESGRHAASDVVAELSGTAGAART